MRLIQQVLRQIDVDRFQPLIERQDQIVARLTNIEESITAAAIVRSSP